MRKLILAPMALACLIGSAVAQQAPTMNVGNFPATQPVTQSGTWGFGLTGPIPAGSNVIGGVTQSGTWNVGLAAGSNAIGSVLADLRVAGAAVSSGNPVPVTVGNFPATQTIAGSVTANIGTTNGLGLDSSLQSIRTALGSPLQAGGSVGISGTPTVNLGTLNGAATAANQTTGNGSLATIATNTTGAATAANQATEIAALQALNTRSSFGGDYAGSLASGATLSGQSFAVSTGLTGSPTRGTSIYTKFSAFFSSSAAGTAYIDGSNDNSSWQPITSGPLSASAGMFLSSPIVFTYYRGRVVNGGSAAGGTLIQAGPSTN